MVFTPDGHCLLVANTQSALGARGFKVVELERYDLAKIQHPTKINLLVNENHDFWGFRRLQIAYSPDGRTLVAADGDTARLFSAEGGEAYITLPFGGQGSDIGGVFFAPDVRTLSAVSLDGHVKFWFARRGVDR